MGGRAKVRKCLYMAAHTAVRCNPVIAPCVKSLRDRGKPYKCAIVAAMRKRTNVACADKLDPLYDFQEGERML